MCVERRQPSKLGVPGVDRGSVRDVSGKRQIHPQISRARSCLLQPAASLLHFQVFGIAGGQTNYKVSRKAARAL